jgi:hypothetical protein
VKGGENVRIEDCYEGLEVIGTPKANEMYTFTIQGVIGVIERIKCREGEIIIRTSLGKFSVNPIAFEPFNSSSVPLSSYIM